MNITSKGQKNKISNFGNVQNLEFSFFLPAEVDVSLTKKKSGHFDKLSDRT